MNCKIEVLLDLSGEISCDARVSGRVVNTSRFDVELAPVTWQQVLVRADQSQLVAVLVPRDLWIWDGMDHAA